MILCTRDELPQSGLVEDAIDGVHIVQVNRTHGLDLGRDWVQEAEVNLWALEVEDKAIGRRQLLGWMNGGDGRCSTRFVGIFFFLDIFIRGLVELESQAFDLIYWLATSRQAALHEQALPHRSSWPRSCCQGNDSSLLPKRSSLPADFRCSGWFPIVLVSSA